MSTIRQNDLAEISGHTVASIRHMQAHNYTPWDDNEFADGKHRRYSALHALALIAVDLLKQQGVSLRDACETVNNQIGTIKRFISAISAGDSLLDLYVGRVGYVENSDKVGTSLAHYSLIGTGTEEELLATIRRCISSLGEENHRGWHSVRIVSGPSVSVVYLPEAYKILQDRAFAAGFFVFGASVRPASDNAPDQ